MCCSWCSSKSLGIIEWMQSNAMMVPLLLKVWKVVRCRCPSICSRHLSQQLHCNRCSCLSSYLPHLGLLLKVLRSNQYSFLVYLLLPVGLQFPNFLGGSMESNGFLAQPPLPHNWKFHLVLTISKADGWCVVKCGICSGNQNIWSLEGEVSLQNTLLHYALFLIQPLETTQKSMLF